MAYEIKNGYKPKTRNVNSMGVYANKAPGWHLAEISNKTIEMCKRNNRTMTEKGVMAKKVQDTYGLTVAKDGANRWLVKNPKGKVGQIVHNGGRSYATLDGARMQRYQDEKQGNQKLMKMREERNYAYEYATIYRLPGDDDGDTPDLARRTTGIKTPTKDVSATSITLTSSLTIMPTRPSSRPAARN